LENHNGSGYFKTPMTLHHAISIQNPFVSDQNLSEDTRREHSRVSPVEPTIRFESQMKPLQKIERSRTTTSFPVYETPQMNFKKRITLPTIHTSPEEFTDIQNPFQSNKPKEAYSSVTKIQPKHRIKPFLNQFIYQGEKNSILTATSPRRSSSPIRSTQERKFSRL
jgi:hypothetical protein